MTQRVPWSVKGITRENRELAKAAAHNAGMSVGAWLTLQIRQAAMSQSAAVANLPGGASSSSPHSLAPPVPTQPLAAWAARAISTSTPGTSRFAFGPGRWRRAAANRTDRPSIKNAEDGVEIRNRVVSTGSMVPSKPGIDSPLDGEPLRRGPAGFANWHAEVTAYQTAVDGILADLRDEVANLRTSRSQDREQIAETMVGLLKHIKDTGAAISKVEEDVIKLRQSVDQLARSPVPAMTYKAADEDSGKVHTALSTTAQAIMRLAVRLDHLETRPPEPGFWKRLLGFGGKPPSRAPQRRTIRRRSLK